jgi:hypothetical protein
VNLYLVEDAGEFIVIDAGYPGYWSQIVAFAVPAAPPRTPFGPSWSRTTTSTMRNGRALRRAGARVLVGGQDEDKVVGRQPSHPPSGFYREIWRPSMIAYLVHTVPAGGAKYRPVEQVKTLSEDRALDLPGRPQVIQTLGHSALAIAGGPMPGEPRRWLGSPSWSA